MITFLPFMRRKTVDPQPYLARIHRWIDGNVYRKSTNSATTMA